MPRKVSPGDMGVRQDVQVWALSMCAERGRPKLSWQLAIVSSVRDSCVVRTKASAMSLPQLNSRSVGMVGGGLRDEATARRRD